MRERERHVIRDRQSYLVKQREQFIRLAGLCEGGRSASPKESSFPGTPLAGSCASRGPARGSQAVRDRRGGRKDESSAADASRSRGPGTIPKVSKIQSVIGQDSQGRVGEMLEEGLTPWDLGKPTPLIATSRSDRGFPLGRALRHVVGVDISVSAIQKSIDVRVAKNKEHFTFLAEDFFACNRPKLFFVQLIRSMRSLGLTELEDLLNVLILSPTHSYEEVATFPVGFKAIPVVDNDSAIARTKVFLAGEEKVERWKKEITKAHID
ncbi:unnamed protein product [Spirodela intermedia]|uniref:Uncharacterized protein n=1 Tax=Spirodela intermedia TaxID=51605 RepID=A0A7I8IR66_SPIIN|nr:unnamed protein product [Spirodela intermedia]CAA6660272.1 unnamed protein product [Spirodela intermedia]